MAIDPLDRLWDLAEKAGEARGYEKGLAEGRRRTPPDGWFHFGSHSDCPGMVLEFSQELGEDYLPLWERPDMVSTLAEVELLRAELCAVAVDAADLLAALVDYLPGWHLDYLTAHVNRFRAVSEGHHYQREM